MKFYAIAQRDHQVFGHGDSGCVTSIRSFGMYGSGPMPPLFHTEEAANEWLRKQAETSVCFSSACVIPLHVQPEDGDLPEPVDDRVVALAVCASRDSLDVRPISAATAPAKAATIDFLVWLEPRANHPDTAAMLLPMIKSHTYVAHLTRGDAFTINIR